MSDLIEHTIDLKIGPKEWEPASEALKRLRQVLKSCGGFSKMVKTSDGASLTLKGPAVPVLDFVDLAGKLQTAAYEAKLKRSENYRSVASELRRRSEMIGDDNVAAILEMVDDIRRKKGK